MDLFARRAAMAHFLFNVGGVIMFIPLAGVLADAVIRIGGDAGQQVANAHLVFNLVTAVVFLIFLTQFQKVVSWMVKGDEKEILLRTEHLQKVMPEDNRQSFRLIERELNRNLDVTRELFSTAFETLAEDGQQRMRRITKLEGLNDYLDDEIERSILQMSKRSLDEDEARMTILLVRMSNLLERLGDHAEDIGDQALEMHKRRSVLPQEQMDELHTVIDSLMNDIDLLGDCLLTVDESIGTRIEEGSSMMNDRIDVIYQQHIMRMREASIPSDSTLLELLTVMESANDKVRELAGMATKYSQIAVKRGDDLACRG